VLLSKEKLQDLDGWSMKEDSIEKEFVFDDFKKALGFVNEVGALAEKEDHHPNIELFAYKKVKITLSTHSEGGVTEKDTDMATGIDKLFET